MKFPLVSRKKYEIAQNNYKLCNEQRKNNAEFTIKLQNTIIDKDIEIKKLKKEIRVLKAKNTKLSKQN